MSKLNTLFVPKNKEDFKKDIEKIIPCILQKLYDEFYKHDHYQIAYYDLFVKIMN